MRILIVTQVFYPDTVSVSQHLWDLASYLRKNGHEVSVLTSKYPYENKNLTYAKYEEIDGVSIYRLAQTKLGKSSTVRRLMDYSSFILIVSLRLLRLKRNNYDVIIGTTVPPLLSFMTLLVARNKRIPFYYWVMDLQPELSIASNLIRENSLSAKFLTAMGNYIIKHSTKLISLDRFMTNYLMSRGAKSNRIFTIPPWPVLEKEFKGERLENPFRVDNSFGNKIVVMYSGNHAFVHPLDTLLSAAKLLKDDNRFLFVFVGGGVRKKDVTHFKDKNELSNIRQLPFQPREFIHISLASADIQVVIMGENQLGYTHPNKVYGALYIGKPILYVGPKVSHVMDILDELDGNIAVEHGDVNSLAKGLLKFADLQEKSADLIGRQNRAYAMQNLKPDLLKEHMLTAIETTV